MHRYLGWLLQAPTLPALLVTGRAQRFDSVGITRYLNYFVSVKSRSFSSAVVFYLSLLQAMTCHLLHYVFFRPHLWKTLTNLKNKSKTWLLSKGCTYSCATEDFLVLSHWVELEPENTELWEMGHRREVGGSVSASVQAPLIRCRDSHAKHFSSFYRSSSPSH